MPLYKIASVPEELDASSDALAGEESPKRSTPVMHRVRSSPSNSPSKSFTSPFLVPVAHSPDINKNTEWFSYPGIWTMYCLILFLVWLLPLSILGSTASHAWIFLNAIHFFVSAWIFLCMNGESNQPPLLRVNDLCPSPRSLRASIVSQSEGWTLPFVCR